MQLRDQPPHDIWLDGRQRTVPFSGAGTLGFLDLRSAPTARLLGPVDSLHVHLPRAALDDLAEDIAAPPVMDLAVERAWKQSDVVMQRLLPLLVTALEMPSAASKPMMDHLLLAVATHIATTYGGMTPGKVRRNSLAPWQVKRAKEMLAANLTKDLSLLEVADACGLSLSYFSRAFKAATGMTPHGWLQACRIERARDLLRGTGQPLADIALSCGFADQSHFTRIFRRATGQGPGAWRRLRPQRDL